MEAKYGNDVSFSCLLLYSKNIEIPIFSLKNFNFTFLGILNILILVFWYFKYSNFIFTSLQYILNFLILNSQYDLNVCLFAFLLNA